MSFVRKLSNRRSSSNDSVHKHNKQTIHVDKRSPNSSQTDGPWSPEIDCKKGNVVKRRCKEDHREWVRLNNTIIKLKGPTCVKMQRRPQRVGKTKQHDY